MHDTITMDDLMAQAGWLRRLAGGLLHDDAAADEAVQETLVSAWRRPPRADGPVRGWLGTVLTNRIRSDARSRRRQLATAARAATEPAEATRTPEDVVAGLQLQRLIASLLLELGAPYRQVIYLRFFDDLDATAIAARLGISPGTARWRLKIGLDELRRRLDERDGERKWRRALAPLAPLGLRFATAPSPLLLGAAALAVVALAGGLLALRGQPGGLSAERPLAPATKNLSRPPAFTPPGAPPRPALALGALAGDPTGEAPASWSRLAPFTGVRWRGDVPEVEVEGVWVELLSIDGVPVDRIVAFSRQRFAEPSDNLWRKRFSEDLVEVLTGMGQPPAAKVLLGIASLADGRRSAVEAALTSESRQRVWRRNMDTMLAAATEFRRVSPFTGLKYDGDAITVEVDGVWYGLVKVQNVTTERLVAFAKEKYRDRWRKRIAEDLFEVLADLGGKPGDTVDLVLKDLASGRPVERKGVTMTAEKRKRLKDTWGPR